MSGAFPRIICDIDIPLGKVFAANPADEMGDGIGHGIHMTRRSGDRLREHIAILIVDPSRQISGLAHRGRKCCAYQGLGLLFNHRDQSVPHHLILYY